MASRVASPHRDSRHPTRDFGARLADDAEPSRVVPAVQDALAFITGLRVIPFLVPELRLAFVQLQGGPT